MTLTRSGKDGAVRGICWLAAAAWRAGEPGLGITMPTGIGRVELLTLTGHGAQLVEVLPVDEYDWAHLPGAVNLPLKDRSRPVIVYCHDSL